jgi:hypothetical protein
MQQSFIEVDDLTYDPEMSSADEAIAKANYRLEISSSDSDTTGAFVQIYITDDESKPHFFIDIVGLNSGIAIFRDSLRPCANSIPC